MGIGYVPQDRGIMRGLTVRETLDLGRREMEKTEAANGRWNGSMGSIPI